MQANGERRTGGDRGGDERRPDAPEPASLFRLLFDVLALTFQIVLAYAESLFRLVFGPPEINLKSLAKEVALITGAGHGIGRELAVQLAALGAEVVLWDIDEKTCRETRDAVEAKGGKAWAFRCDVSNRAEVAEAAEKTRSALTPGGRPVSLLVNNAGIMPARPFLKFRPGQIERLFQVNVFSQVYTLQEFLPDFYARNRGHVVAISSVCGITGTANLVPYCATKFAIKGLMEGLAAEQRSQRPEATGVKLTTIHPFTINTGLAKDAKTRFPRIVPILEAWECAERIVWAIRAEQEEVYVPKRLRWLFNLSKLMPKKAQAIALDFMECTVGENEAQV